MRLEPEISMVDAIKRIGARMLEGVPMEVACTDIQGCPDPWSIKRYLDGHTEAKDYIHDCSVIGAHRMAISLRDVARGGIGSTGDSARDKMIVDLDLKLLSKWHRGIYGDKSSLEVDAKVSLEQMVLNSMRHEQAGLTIEQDSKSGGSNGDVV
ncbi:MAG: hypothetical protein KGJ90_05010 [Patescibacteria group bacterium]|nr:hypothetical protein [Patescibacteria group bacterium]